MVSVLNATAFLTAGDGLHRVVVREPARESTDGLDHLLVVAQPLAELHIFGPRAIKDVLELPAFTGTTPQHTDRMFKWLRLHATGGHARALSGEGTAIKCRYSTKNVR